MPHTPYKDIQNEKQALAYMVDCTLASVDSLAMKKKPPAGEFTRQKAIAQKGSSMIEFFGIKAYYDRIYEVIEFHDGNVESYADGIREMHDHRVD